MRSPSWLNELRTVLAVADDAARQQAMKTWEARWLIDLHCVKMITDGEHVEGRIDLLEHMASVVRHDLGNAIGDLMADLTIQECPHPWAGPGYQMEVRGDVIAMRREPKRDA